VAPASAEPAAQTGTDPNASAGAGNA
jgi:hypothetical protein